MRFLRVLPFVPALVILAWDPALWLGRSWFDDTFASNGEWVFLLVVALVAWSVRSGLEKPVPRADIRRALWLELSTAAIRVLGIVVAVRTIGGIALVVDVYALCLSLGVRYRRMPLSPLGVAMLFALTLPMERLLQRGLGYPLQLLSAKGACALLEPIYGGLQCSGTLLQLEGAALSVDLPCSGAQGLVLLSAVLCSLVALRRLTGRRLVAGALFTVGGAIGANALRLFLLAVGVVHGIDVLSEPLHSAVGLSVLAVAAFVLLSAASASARPYPHASSGGAQSLRFELRSAALLFCASLFVFIAPERPVDVSAVRRSVALPSSIDELSAVPIELSAKEEEYFRRFGGSVAKAHYAAGASDHTVLLVRTAAPLRHMHGPDECLVGAGHRVELIGVREADKTSVYRSTAPDGTAWRVEVSFLSSGREHAFNPAEVAWRWLRAPEHHWTMVERVSRWSLCETDPSECAGFDQRLFSLLEVQG